jgi:sporulation protein YlmC with PRC-barrel domain
LKQLHPHSAELARLSDTDLVPAQLHQDIRNRKVVDWNGAAIGHIDDLFIDEKERKVRMLQIRAGGFLGLGERHFLLPVDTITNVTDAEVRVNETLEHIVGSPVYDPKLIAVPTQSAWGPYYGYYGLSPFWDNGYVYPHFPTSEDETVRRDRFIR